MGRRTADTAELANSVAQAAFTATGRSPAVMFNPGLVNVSIWGTFVGTVRLEKSYDGGQTWHVFDVDLAGTNMEFTAERHIQLQEAESGILYSWNCTAFTSGTINCRASQG